MIDERDPLQSYRPLGPLRLEGAGSLECARRLSTGQRVCLRRVQSSPAALAAIESALGLPRHPAIAAPIDAGTWQGEAWLVTDFPEGALLGEHEGKTWNAQALAADFGPLAHALTVLHAQGICHGLISGDALLVDAGGKLLLHEVPLLELNRASDRRPEQTQLAQLQRTAAFLSPQRLKGGAPTTADDVYALGALLCLATGGERLGRASVLEQLHAVMNGAWTPQAPAGLPAALTRLLERMTAREPSLRPDAGEAARQLRAFDAAQPEVTDPFVPSTPDPLLVPRSAVPFARKPSPAEPETVLVPAATAGRPTGPRIAEPIVAKLTGLAVAKAAEPVVPKVTDLAVPKLTELAVPKLTEPSVPKLPDLSVPKVTELAVPKVIELAVPKLTELAVPKLTEPVIGLTELTLSSDTEPGVSSDDPRLLAADPSSEPALPVTKPTGPASALEASALPPFVPGAASAFDPAAVPAFVPAGTSPLPAAQPAAALPIPLRTVPGIPSFDPLPAPAPTAPYSSLSGGKLLVPPPPPRPHVVLGGAAAPETMLGGLGRRLTTFTVSIAASDARLITVGLLAIAMLSSTVALGAHVLSSRQEAQELAASQVIKPVVPKEPRYNAEQLKQILRQKEAARREY